ncbi:unnamed protein product [Rangifer tarandus platyrhynchus]|uniref:Uncharacterized protein n=1 Tax=Rangifer tarandus platyrhynchus TaxID=3082113 RepID=A0AC59ZV48_RANTA
MRTFEAAAALEAPGVGRGPDARLNSWGPGRPRLIALAPSGEHEPAVARSAWWRLLSERSRPADPGSVSPAQRVPEAGWKPKQQQP